MFRGRSQSGGCPPGPCGPCSPQGGRFPCPENLPNCCGPSGPTGPVGPTGPTGPGPVGPTGATTFVQSASASLGTPVSTGSPTPVPILSLPITTTGGNLLIQASFAAQLSALGPGPLNSIQFQLTLDGNPIRGAGISPPVAGADESGAIVARVAPVPAGPHTIGLQWDVVGGGTALIDPIANPLGEHANITAEEVLT